MVKKTKRTVRKRQKTGTEYVVNVNPSGGFRDVDVYHTYDHTHREHTETIPYQTYREKVLMRKVVRNRGLTPPPVRRI